MRIFALIFALCMSGSGLAQDAAETNASADADRARPVIDPSLAASPRAKAMGGAIAPFADELDAVIQNPAGIGGRTWGKRNPPWVRKLYFPYVYSATNKNSTELNQDFSDQQGARDKSVGAAIIDAHAGKRQYGRAGGTLGMIMGRLALVPFYDAQLAAVSHGGGTNLIDTIYRDASGIAFGSSVSDGDGYFSLGYSGVLLSIDETRGDFLYDEIIDTELRKSAIADNTTSYSGLAHNIGGTLRLAKVAAPSITVVARNFGGTTLSASDGAEDLEWDENLTLAFSVTPMLGKSNLLNIALQGDRLTDSDVTLAKKSSFGIEWLLGLDRGVGSYATFALRAGYNGGGPAYGLGLNLGLIGFDVSVASVDLGSENISIPEERYSASFFVNVSEF